MMCTAECSICIPTYNGVPSLAESIESALCQTMSPLEIIISDDGSTDGTDRTVASFKDSRIRWFPCEGRRGLHANHNRCVQYARTEWVLFLHQDDMLTANAVAQYAALIASAGEIGVAFGELPHLANVCDGNVLTFPQGFLRLLKVGGLTPSGTLYRKSALRDVGGFDERHRMADMALLLASRGCSLGVVRGRNLVVRPRDSTFPAMILSGETHRGSRLSMRRIFSSRARTALSDEIVRDLPRWRGSEVASLLRRCAQAELWDIAWTVWRKMNCRVAEVAATRDFYHFLLVWLLGQTIYWCVLAAYKRMKVAATALEAWLLTEKY